MEKTFIAVRDVDTEAFRKFKIMSMKEKLKVGEALTIAMKRLMQEKENRTNNGVKSLLKIRPFDFGKGTEKLSKEVNQILYG